MSKKKSHEEFVKEVAKKRPGYTVYGIYKDNRTKIEIGHDKCGFRWLITPNNFLTGKMCPKCAGNIKKSHEEFAKEMSEKRPGYTVYGTYKNAYTKIEIGHDECGYRWFADPRNLLQGKGCPKCAKKQLTKTHEEFIKEVSEKMPGYTVYGTYKNSRTKIEIGHDECGYRWFARPTNILQGEGCPKCAGNIKKSHEEFVKELAKKMPGYTAYGMYKNGTTEIEIGHDECGYRWFTTPNVILDRHGCPKCAGNIKKSHEEFVKELAKKMPGYTVYGTYKNSRTKIEIGHDECGYRWFTTPNAILDRHGCPRCSGHLVLQEDFIKTVAEKMPEYTVYGAYKGFKSKVEIGHNKCGFRWLTTPKNILRGRGCPKCNESKGESAIAALLKKHNIDFVYQHTFDDCRRKNVLPFDFYIPIVEVAIEYDGEQHFRPIEYFGGADGLKYRQENDRIKSEFCASNGIKLVRIRYDDDIEKVLGEALGW